MEIVYSILIAAAIILWFLFFLFVLSKDHNKKISKPSVKFVARVAIFGAISTVLYTVPVLKFSIPIFPSFLELHFDEIPALIASFAYGPWTGIAIIAIKTVIKLPMTSTLCVGELADLIYSIALIIPASVIYQKHRKFSGAMLGLLVGTVSQLVVSVLCNIYIMIPFYMYVMGFSEEALLGMCQAVNPNITNLGWTLGLYAILPFNALKDGIVIIITILVYKSLHRFIDKLN